MDEQFFDNQYYKNSGTAPSLSENIKHNTIASLLKGVIEGFSKILNVKVVNKLSVVDEATKTSVEKLSLDLKNLEKEAQGIKKSVEALNKETYKVSFPEISFPKLQNISGKVEVTNQKDVLFPKVQEVVGKVEVINQPSLEFPKKQEVSGVVSVSNLKDVVIPKETKVSGKVEVSNFPNTTKLDGPVEVSNLGRVVEGLQIVVDVINELKLDIAQLQKQNYDQIVAVSGSGGKPLTDEAGHLQADVLSMPAVTVDSTDTDAKFYTNHVDDYTTTSVTYVGKEDDDGVWQILKMDESGNFPVLTYASISNNPTLTTYSAAWSARTSATYNLYSVAF